MTLRLRLAAGTALATLMISTPAQAQDNAALQRQIDELKAQVQALTAALAANKGTQPVAAAPVPAPAAESAAPPVALAAAPTAPAAVPVSAEAPKSKAWYEKLSLRGFGVKSFCFLSALRAARSSGVSFLRFLDFLLASLLPSTAPMLVQRSRDDVGLPQHLRCLHEKYATLL